MGSPSFSSRAVIAVLMPDLFEPHVLHAVRVTSSKGTENEMGNWERKEGEAWGPEERGLV